MRDWLFDFLEKRDLIDQRTDGRPLYAYRCTLEEYESLKSLLFQKRWWLNNSNINIRYEKRLAYLFTLYCSEWWRRFYSGGPWAWHPILESLEWDIDHAWTSRLISDGLHFWKRDLRNNSNGRLFLLSAATEGGIPVCVLEKNGVSFKKYLKAVMREYGEYFNSGADVVQIAINLLNYLPKAWQQDQIAVLSGQIVEQIWDLKLDIGEKYQGAIKLEEAYPNWLKRLPLELENEQGNLLINSLLNTARNTSPKDNKIFKIERRLENKENEWLLTAKLVFPQELDIQQIVKISNINSGDEIPERMELYSVSGSERKLVAWISGANDKRFIRPTHEAIRTFTTNAEQEHSLVFVSRGKNIASCSMVGGEALDSELPWCFVKIDDDENRLRWVGQGGCQRCEADIYILAKTRPLALNADLSFGVKTISDNVLNKTLWNISTPIVLSSELIGEEFYFSPGLEEIAERDFLLSGNHSYFPETRYPLYNSIPLIQSVQNRLIRDIEKDKIYWRSLGNSEWHSFNERDMVGDIQLRYCENKFNLASWKLSIIPSDAKIKIIPISSNQGEIILTIPNATVAIERESNLSVSVEYIDNICRINCAREDFSIGQINGKLSWDNNCKLNFSIPFPAEGGSFSNKDGVELSIKDEISLTKLYGIKAQAVSPNSAKKYTIRGSLISKDNTVSALKYHKFEYDMAFDETGISTIPLQQLKSEIEILFAVSTGVNDLVKIEIMTDSKPEATVVIKQFENHLVFNNERRMIHLNTSNFIENYFGTSLKLISITDITSEPIILEWNEISAGWTLPIFSDENIDLSHTYFAVVNCANPYNIRPCILPSELELEDVQLSPLAKSMVIANREDRLESITNYLSNLKNIDTFDGDTELCQYLRCLSDVHPDGLDLVECIIEFPEIMASLWFESTHDSKLNGYLQKICETSPFSWWMINIEQWKFAAEKWNRKNSIHPDEIKKILLTKCVDALYKLSADYEELNYVVDILLEFFGEKLPHNSIMRDIRNYPSKIIWEQLDRLCRSVYMSSIDGHWPKIEDIFTLRNKLSANIFNYIDWPIKDTSSYRFSVIYTPIIAAAALHEGIELGEEQRITLLAAKNFHPIAFATLFRASQATLWEHNEEF